MYPTQHLILGTLFSIIIFVNFPQIGFSGFFLIVLATFLIDVDHYLFYAAKKRDLDLKRAYLWFVKFMEKRKKLSAMERKKYKHHILIFHGIEFWVILGLLSFAHVFFFYIFLGVMFHILLDMLSLTINKQGFSCILSQSYNLFHNIGKKDLLPVVFFLFLISLII